MWMKLETVIVSEVKSDGGGQISYDIAYTWNLKKQKWYQRTYL